LKLIFVIVFRAVSLLRLSRRESWWKDAEILMLRHQLAVAERERPRAHSRLTWPDRAWLAPLAGMLPLERLSAMRLIVTPGTILRWHRDIVGRRWARRSRHGRPDGRDYAAMSGRWCFGWPGRMSHGDTAAFMASLPGWAPR
jgi:putative transposase